MLTQFPGVIVGTGHKNKCFECIKHILKHGEHLSGIALAGITDGTEESLQVPVQKLEEIFRTVGVSAYSAILPHLLCDVSGIQISY